MDAVLLFCKEIRKYAFTGFMFCFVFFFVYWATKQYYDPYYANLQQPASLSPLLIPPLFSYFIPVLIGLH